METLEARRARLAALERRDWRTVQCRTCGAGCIAAPGQEREAMCGGCRLLEAATVTTIQRLPAIPPPALGWEGYKINNPENGLERVELVPPESVCPLFTYGQQENGCGHEAPAPVGDLAGAALLAGWRVARGHSRGRAMGGNGKQLAVADMWTVRFRREGWMGYAARRGAAWDSVCVAGVTLPPFLALGVTELREWLEQPEQGAEWYGAIRERREAQARSSKIVKCPGPGECAWVTEQRGDHTHRADGAIKPKISRKEQQGAL